MKLEYPPQFFEKFSNIKPHRNPSNGSRVVPCRMTHGQTDRHTDRQDESSSLFLLFCERS